MRNLNSKMSGLVLVLALGLTILAPQTVQAQVIMLVIRGGSSTNTPPAIAPNPLGEDVLSFVDRTHQYNAVPADLLGAQYVMVANNDKVQADYSLDVELIESARLYLFLDNRLGHGATPGGDPALNPDLWSAGMSWVYDIGFADTGLNIGIDEGGDGQINQWASVYVKKVEPGLIRLYQQNDPTDPTYRNMYGVAALKQRLFAPFWTSSTDIPLRFQTGGWVTIPTGFWIGWYWGQHQGFWFHPGQGYVGLVAGTDDYPAPYPYHPGDYPAPYPYKPGDYPAPYPYWRGWPHFWAFTGSMTFRMPDPDYTLRAWNYFLSNGNQGNCIQLIAVPMTSDVDPFLSPTFTPSPVDKGVVESFEIQSHTFSVNGGAVRNEFSQLAFIQTSRLEDYIRELGMTEADIRAFMTSEIVEQLSSNDPGGGGYVGVQHAQWIHPAPSISYSTNSLEITEGEQVEYGVSLRQPPSGPVTVNVVSSYPTIIKWADFDGGMLQLHFDRSNWDKPQIVSLIAQDPWRGGPQMTYCLSHFLSNDLLEGSVLPVKARKKGCDGALRLYDGDVNNDCTTDFRDVAIVALSWLESTEPPEEIDPFTNHDDFKSRDIGSSGGSAVYKDNEWTIEADGPYIFGTSDGFHYVYRPIWPHQTASFQLTATVRSLLLDAHEWSKAGIMVRKTLEPDSAHVLIAVTLGRGVVFQWRPEAGAESHSIHSGPGGHLEAPVSLRLVVSGGTTTGYYYSNGMWIEQGSVSLVPPTFELSGGYIGLAVTSSVEGELTTATFSHELISSNPIPLP